jgi:8-oxo-dGTP pyrophosphatase MutT (NUDIX family)
LSRALKRIARLTGQGEQYGALPFRRSAEGVEVLLITSRESRRWTAPKGWPMKRRLPQEAAAIEALEEAGVSGVVEDTVIGVYSYAKRLRDGTTIRCRVQVFLLEVTDEHDTWPEAEQRERAWFSPQEAAARVSEPGLQAILSSLDARFS